MRLKLYRYQESLLYIRNYIKHCREFWQKIVADLETSKPGKPRYLGVDKEQALQWESELSKWLRQLDQGAIPKIYNY